MVRKVVPLAALVGGLCLLLVGMHLELSAAFAVGALTCTIAIGLLALPHRRERSRALTTPAMGDLVSDVREQDRALRDGMWLLEYEMRDDGPRRIIGWALFLVVGLVLWKPVYFVLAAVADRSPVVASLVVVGFVVAVAALMRRSESGMRSTG